MSNYSDSVVRYFTLLELGYNSNRLMRAMTRASRVTNPCYRIMHYGSPSEFNQADYDSCETPAKTPGFNPGTRRFSVLLYLRYTCPIRAVCRCLLSPPATRSR